MPIWPAVGDTKSMNGYGRALAISDTVPASMTVPDSVRSSYSIAVVVAVRLVKRMPGGPSPPARVHLRDAGNVNPRELVAYGSTTSSGIAAAGHSVLNNDFAPAVRKGSGLTAFGLLLSR